MLPYLLPLFIIGFLLIALAMLSMDSDQATLPRFLVLAAGTYLALFGCTHLVSYAVMGMV
jgi:hypothetical protein